MTALINRTLGENRGSPRIYLDDELLEQLGVTPTNNRYNREWLDNKLILRLTPDGKYTVSSKTKNGKIVSVLDTCTNQLSTLFEKNQKLRIAIKAGVVIIQSHTSEDNKQRREHDYLTKAQNGSTLMAGSCFHGGGIMDSALHSGFKKSGVNITTSFAIELEQKYLLSSMNNNKHLFNSKTVFINSDIGDVHAFNIPEVNLMFAGIPCVGASNAGKAKNKIANAESHKTAGDLFFHFLNIFKASNAAVGVIENVPTYIDTTAFIVIKSVLSSLGYDLHTDIYSGGDYGSPENRKRMICVVVSKGLSHLGFEKLIPEMMNAGKRPQLKLIDCLLPIADDSTEWKEVIYLKEKMIKDRAAGKGFAMQLLRPDDTCGVLGKGYKKSRSTEPRLLHPTNESLSRLFTKDEHSLIKQAPLSIVAGLSETIGHEILGNSVTYSMFECLGEVIGIISKVRGEVYLAA
jgi:DNA (cytosine-5)-methyltransferase 1